MVGHLARAGGFAFLFFFLFSLVDLPSSLKSFGKLKIEVRAF